MSQDIIERKIKRGGLAIVDACEGNKLTCRLLGGVAIAYLVRDVYPEVPALIREPKDIDIAAHRRDSGKLTKTLEGLGLRADVRFNALHGAERLRFFDTQMNMRLMFSSTSLGRAT
ncbi:hypothetical protein [Vulcanisaeta distributa]|uniref:hypothetical protein n=1 Tax=Vulcanisaeta distributa TaxID=164451 RepID=UPI000A88F430|nr:hypothetical protein [Vulcanisaeta distributa]